MLVEAYVTQSYFHNCCGDGSTAFRYFGLILEAGKEISRKIEITSYKCRFKIIVYNLSRNRPLLKQSFPMLKLLKNEPQVEVLPNEDFQLKDVGICLWEPEPSFLTYVPTPPSECPVCGSSQFEEGKRLSALLNPRFESGFRYVMLVWVHPKCFDDCIETSEPEPQPW